MDLLSRCALILAQHPSPHGPIMNVRLVTYAQPRTPTTLAQ